MLLSSSSLPVSPVPPLADDAAYRVLLARDARFDGRLFVGVTSTGVYCRPVCRVRTPRRENCRFFANAAQAEAAAFRPCLKCRPELAPGLSLMDSSQALAQAAARSIEQAVHAGQPVVMPVLAGRLGVTDRHLRRIFVATHGVTPQDYLATQRLLWAKRLLTDTTLPVTQVALASGFGSLRRFHAAFAQRYRLQPTALRRSDSPAANGLSLAWRPPYDSEAVLGFFARRTLAGIDQVEGRRLRRTLALQSAGGDVHAGWIEIEWQPAPPRARQQALLRTDAALAPVLGAVLQRVRHALDLDADPARIDPVLASLPVPPREGARLPGAFDPFETSVRVVLGQQVTVAAARTLLTRLVARLGTPISTPFPGLDRLFPDAGTLAAADPEVIGRLGIVRQRVRAVQALATAVAEGRITLQPGAPVGPTLDALLALPGIGPWTAQVIAMRALAWPDAWPASDIGLMNALGSRDARTIESLGETWRPWRAYAVMRLWHHLETRS